MILKEAINSTRADYGQEQWLLKINHAALYIAAGGYIDEATAILVEVWKYRIPYDRTTWLTDRAFEVLWHVSGKRPFITPFPQSNIDELEVAHRDYLVSPSGEFMPHTTVDNYVKAQMFCRSTNGKLPYKDMEETALSLFLPLIGDKRNFNALNSYTVSKIVALVTELAAKNNKQEIAVSELKKWGSKIGRYPYDASLQLIAANRHVAPLLLGGLIKSELELNDKVVKQFFEQMMEALNYRKMNGLTYVFGGSNWQQLIKQLSELAIQDSVELFSEEQKSSQWIGYAPAKEEDILQKEKELGITFPSEFREFLLTSNGLASFSGIQPILSSVNEIDFLKKRYFDVYGDYELFELTKGYPGNGSEPEDFGALLESAIGISNMVGDEDEVWLIPPRGNIKDWECWSFSPSNPGEERHKNFRYYIESCIQFLERYT